MKAFDYKPIFKKTTLENGVRVLTEHHPYSRTVSSGLFLGLGTRDEPLNLNGAAHFVEHIVFKGTKKRSSYDIARVLEAVGGELNAYTGKENTCFHAASLREDLNLSLDVISDLVSNACFTLEDFKKERSVILQEINMSADLLEEHIFDLYFELCFKGHSLSSPILGTEKSLNQITKESLNAFYKSRYQSQNIIVGIAGSVDHNQAVDQIQKYLKFNLTPEKNVARKAPEVMGFTKIIPKLSEQVHLLLGLPSSSYQQRIRFAAYIVNAYLGGGMTSKLYQVVREQGGYAYSIYSYLQSFTDSGLILFYAGCSEKNITKVYEIIIREITQLKNKGMSEEDLKYFKTQVTGSIVLGADDVENRMNSLGINEMIFGEYQAVENILEEIQSITTEDIQDYINEYFDFSKIGRLIIGNVKENILDDLL